jgi:hypothetical protein
MSFDTDGTIGPNIVTGSLLLSSGDPIFTVVTYQNGVVTATLTDTSSSATFSASTNINIPAVLGTNVAFIGFTGGDGASKATQQISDFSFVSLPVLSAQAAGTNLLLSWPAAIGAYMLEQSPVLGRSATWTPVTATPTYANGDIQVKVPFSGKDSFFQLVATNVPNF